MSSEPILSDSGELAKLSRELFAIDDKSREILCLIGKKGPMTIYELYKSSAGSLSKTAIHRRIHGERNLISLLNENYLRLEGKTKFLRTSTNLERKYYGLTLKGFLAALSKIPCEEIYMFEAFLETYKFNEIIQEPLQSLDETKRTKIWQAFIDQIKTDLLIFLRYHYENGMMLTHVKHTNPYFEIFWSSIIPFGSTHDPLSQWAATIKFSDKWGSLWERRRSLIEETRLTYKSVVEEVGRRRGRVKSKLSSFYLGCAHSPGPGEWVRVFNECWVTRNEVEGSWSADWMLDPLITSYVRIIGSLRGGKVPWKIEELFLPEGGEWHPALEITNIKAFRKMQRKERDIAKVLSQAQQKGIVKMT